MDRRRFLQLGAGAFFLLKSCKQSGIPLQFENGNPIAHRLRNQDFPAPERTMKTPLLIVGGGVAGLSFRRAISKQGWTDSLLIESEEKIGGNSQGSSFGNFNYPLGAHYLPVPDPRNTALIEFLEESGLAIKQENELAIYSELDLVHEPEERLFREGYWQNNLVPNYGLTPLEKAEIKRFFEEVEKYKNKKGKDGKDFFRLPISACSIDEEALALDSLSFANHLYELGFKSKPLLDYLDYCTRDDFGSTLEQCSAWAGWHYFASRKGSGQNASSDDLLTWPNGNQSLIEQLKKQGKGRILSKHTLVKLIPGKPHKAWIWDETNKETIEISCAHLALATPQFVNKKILPQYANLFPNWEYMPWMVANLHMKNLPQGKGQVLSWDNVWYGKSSLGYVYAGHQLVGNRSLEGVITLYFPLVADNVKISRNKAREKNEEQWFQEIDAELKWIHPNWKEDLIACKVKLWGHAMPRPIPGFRNYSSQALIEALNKENMYVANADLWGMSLFEEAFYSGLAAADKLRNKYGTAKR